MFATVQDFFARVGIPQDDYTQIGDMDSRFDPSFSISQKYPFQSFWARSSSERKSHREKNTKSNPNLG